MQVSQRAMEIDPEELEDGGEDSSSGNSDSGSLTSADSHPLIRLVLLNGSNASNSLSGGCISSYGRIPIMS